MRATVARRIEQFARYADDVEVLEELQEISAEALAKQGAEPRSCDGQRVLMSAIHQGASDIHIEPYEKGPGPLPHRRDSLQHMTRR